MTVTTASIGPVNLSGWSFGGGLDLADLSNAPQRLDLPEDPSHTSPSSENSVTDQLMGFLAPDPTKSPGVESSIESLRLRRDQRRANAFSKVTLPTLAMTTFSVPSSSSAEASEVGSFPLTEVSHLTFVSAVVRSMILFSEHSADVGGGLLAFLD